LRVRLELRARLRVRVRVRGQIEVEGGVGFVDKFRREIEVIPLFVCNLKHGNEATGCV
jgi:hypothetical protein